MPADVSITAPEAPNPCGEAASSDSSLPFCHSFFFAPKGTPITAQRSSLGLFPYINPGVSVQKSPLVIR